MIIIYNPKFQESLSNERQKRVYTDLVKKVSLFGGKDLFPWIGDQVQPTIRNIFDAFSNMRLGMYTDLFLGKKVNYPSLCDEDKKKVFNEFRRQCISICRKMETLPERFVYNKGTINFIHANVSGSKYSEPISKIIPWCFVSLDDCKKMEKWIDALYQEFDENEEAKYEDLLCEMDEIVARSAYYKGKQGTAIRAKEIIVIQEFISLLDEKLVNKVWKFAAVRTNDIRHWADGYDFDFQYFTQFKNRFITLFLRPLEM